MKYIFCNPADFAKHREENPDDYVVEKYSLRKGEVLRIEVPENLPDRASFVQKEFEEALRRLGAEELSDSIKKLISSLTDL